MIRLRPFPQQREEQRKTVTAALADYRESVQALLATAVDASIWTTVLIDQALRTALQEYDQHFIYESSLTVSVAGHAQDVSSLVDLKDVVAVAYPWTDGVDFARRQQRWRYVDCQRIYLEDVAPVAGQNLRLRYKRAHTIDDLDAATETTVPDVHQQMLSLLAASYACVLRQRQVSENPAIPDHTAKILTSVSKQLANAAALLMNRTSSAQPATWQEIGL